MGCQSSFFGVTFSQLCLVVLGGFLRVCVDFQVFDSFQTVSSCSGWVVLFWGSFRLLWIVLMIFWYFRSFL